MEIQANAMLLELPNWNTHVEERASMLLEKYRKSRLRAHKAASKTVQRCEPRVDSNLFSVSCFLTTLVDIFHLFGMRKPNTKDEVYNRSYKTSLEDTLTLWMEYSNSKGPDTVLWKDLGKWKACSFFSAVFNQDIPPAPDGLTGKLLNPRFLLSGVFKVYLKQIISVNRSVLRTFAVTILQSKKGAPPLSSAFVQETEYKTYKQLTTPPKVHDPIAIRIEPENVWLCSNELDTFELRTPTKAEVRPAVEPYGNREKVISEDWIKEELRRTTLEIFGQVSMSPEDVYEPIFPSTSANYRYGRDNLGSVAAFYDVCQEAGKCDSLMKTDLGHAELIDQLPVMYGERRRKEQEVLKEQQKDAPNRREALCLLYDPSEIEEKWRSAYDQLWQYSWTECPMVRMIGLTEPFKVRTITAGPPATMAVLHPFQRFFWKRLRKFRVFKLIGEKISAENVFQSLGYLNQNEEFGSGDYVGSTDNLKSWVSETINETLFNCLMENSKDLSCEFLQQAKVLCKRSLTGHFLENPFWDLDHFEFDPLFKKEGFDTSYCQPQRNGQLMGSITSFIFLCIANAALCRASLELSDQKRYSLKDVPLMINGDDCVFRMQKGTGRVCWEQITRMAGLSSSVGKTYFSDQLVVMNSVHYHYEVPSWEEGPNANPLKEIKYINMGLVYGQKKSGERGKEVHMLGSLHQELKKTCPEQYWPSASKLFLKRNKEALQKYKLPWYLPGWLGGLGLVPPDNWDDLQDRMVAHSIMTSINKMENSSKMFSYDVPKVVGCEPKWLMYNLVLQELNKNFGWLDKHPYKEVEYEGTTRNLEEESLNFRKWKIIELLFTNPLQYDETSDREVLFSNTEDIYYDWKRKVVVDKRRFTRDLQHNERCWATHVGRVLNVPNLNKECFLNAPAREDLETVKNELFLPVFNNRLARSVDAEGQF